MISPNFPVGRRLLHGCRLNDNHRNQTIPETAGSALKRPALSLCFLTKKSDALGYAQELAHVFALAKFVFWIQLAIVERIIPFS